MHSSNQPDRRAGNRQKNSNLLRRELLLITCVLLAALTLLSWPVLKSRTGTEQTRKLQLLTPAISLPSESSSATPVSTSSTPPGLAASSSVTQSLSSLCSLHSTSLYQGLTLLALGDGAHTHLFTYRSAGSPPLLRLTYGDWDDLHPAFSPDGTSLAFSSNRSGFWDLYLMNLSTGEVTQLTDDPDYDGHPSFSPDGRWLVYEHYVNSTGTNGSNNGNLELFIRPVDGSADPIRLTDDPAADFDPNWSPKGRQIAFVSTRNGNSEVWLADLDQAVNRFQNLSKNKSARTIHPVWSPDGSALAWSSRAADGVQAIFVMDVTTQIGRPRRIGLGDWAAWSPDGGVIIASIQTPNQTYITAYDRHTTALAFPALPMDGDIQGIAWGAVNLPTPPPLLLEASMRATPTPLWNLLLSPQSEGPTSRQQVVILEDVTAPNPMLQDQVDEAFQALRARISVIGGWDFLANLDNAFVPLTVPLEPGMGEDWLYTGRAFAFNSLPLNAGWLAIVKEDYGPQTFWRIFLRARYQDGSQGMPLRDLPWDLNARFGKDPRDYEQGGARLTAPLPGYWVDFTALAAAYGFERLSALSTWRSSFSSARFNEFVFNDELDWLNAMRQIYPEEALATQTPIPTETPTSTPTPRPTRTPWLSPTPRPTNIPWMIPTRTFTPTPTATGSEPNQENIQESATNTPTGAPTRPPDVQPNLTAP